MSDPRYRNGIKKNTAIHLERPTEHGWKELGVNPETGRMVYVQDGCKLTRLFGPGWLATNRNGQEYHITDCTLKEATERILIDPWILIKCIECGNGFDRRLPDVPEPQSPRCDVCLKESIVNVLLAA